MSDAEKYLKQLNELKRVDGFRKTLKEYRRIQKENRNDLKYHEQRIKDGLKYLNKLDDEKDRDVYIKQNKANIGAIAYSLMGTGNPEYFLMGARLYEEIGKGEKIMGKLMEDVNLAFKNGMMRESYYLGVQNFIKRNSGKKKSGSLEGKLPVFLLLTIAGMALSLSSLNTTGYAISSITQETPGLLGIIFFIFGLAGIFFTLKK